MPSRLPLLCCAILLIARTGLARQQPAYSLQDIIEKARSCSYSAKLVATQQEVSYYQFLTYKSDFRPQVSFYGNAPVYNKEYYAVRQPDGSITYQHIRQNNSSIGFGISQQLPFTGGTISLNTDLARFDDFEAKRKQYNGTPVYLQFNQPLFAVNTLKWNRLIEPMKYEEAKRQFVAEKENIAQQVTSLYFIVLTAQSNIDIAQSNLLITKENYAIEKKRIDLGTTTEDKLLQLELQSLKSKQELDRATYDYTIAQLNLKTYIGCQEEGELILKEPEYIPVLNISLPDALSYAKKNRPEFIAFQRKLKEAQRDVAVAKAAKQQVSLVASYGLNNIGGQVGDVYQNPNNQQRFSIGFNIPILDWGRRNARYNTAKAMEKLAETTNEFDEVNINQAITTLIKNIELLGANITLAQKTAAVAQRRYTIAHGLYQLGKLTVTDLSLAQSEKDNSQRNYINALRDFWDGYYLLRKLTLFDFEKQAPLLSQEANR
ncbi:MAG: TolC family protein [Candidatus Pseudobacter hemicellulosilyticus]|uniref:TolC family protein n=1 Tax=Candidatus Pseudobacter hemicellulosilyticus TaxID=3121375 RepID=A0AAJ5WMX5_9BACT|nr:MAG: TolC family protein [Pseudobacter sp.]